MYRNPSSRNSVDDNILFCRSQDRKLLLHRMWNNILNYSICQGLNYINLPRCVFQQFPHSFTLDIITIDIYTFSFFFKAGSVNRIDHRATLRSKINFTVLHDDCHRSRKFFSRVCQCGYIRRIQSVDDLIDNEILRRRFLSAVRRHGRNALRSLRSAIAITWIIAALDRRDSRKRNLPFARG